MSYTAPTYVDTKEQAILALASTIADSDKTLLGDGSVNKALDVLADCLAEHDVSVPQTDAGAILALAQYVSGGGGGTVDVGALNYTIFVINENDPEPSVGNKFSYESAHFTGAWIGDKQIVDGANVIAAGASGVIHNSLTSDQPTAYLVAVDPDTYEITAVETTAIDYSIVDVDGSSFLKLTIPEPDPSDKGLVIGTFGGGK